MSLGTVFIQFKYKFKVVTFLALMTSMGKTAKSFLERSMMVPSFFDKGFKRGGGGSLDPEGVDDDEGSDIIGSLIEVGSEMGCDEGEVSGGWC